MVFISYSWDSDEHIEKVAQLIKLLKKSGIKVSWDQDLKLGRRIPSFMEEELQKCDQVLFICTPNYKLKADGRDGGVGYETNVITGELYRSHNDTKFIPVLFDGNWDASMPVWANGKLGADLRNGSMQEYEKLLDALCGQEVEPCCEYQEETEDVETDQASEPPGAEERRALERIYSELLDIKTWLVQLKRTGNGMEDPSGSEDEMWKKVKALERLKDTYDFILNRAILGKLDEFFRWWKNFQYFYTHFDEEITKDAAKKKGPLSCLFSVDANGKLKNSYNFAKRECKFN